MPRSCRAGTAPRQDRRPRCAGAPASVSGVPGPRPSRRHRQDPNEDTSRYFTEIGHTCPAPIPLAQTEALVAANAPILEVLRFDSGITHAEFRLCDGRPVLTDDAYWPTVVPTTPDAAPRCVAVMVSPPRGARLSSALHDSTGRSACVVVDLPWIADPIAEVPTFTARVELEITTDPT